MTPQNGLLIFRGKETHPETKSWKSSRILTKKITTTTINPGIVEDFPCEPKFLHSSLFVSIIFLHFSLFLFFFFIFSFFSFFSFFHFLSFSFISFHFLSFSFIFFPFLSFSFIFFHFLSFSVIFFVFVGCSKSDFFWASISLRFLLTVLK